MLRIVHIGKDADTGEVLMMCQDSETGEFRIKRRCEKAHFDVVFTPYKPDGRFARHFKGGMYRLLLEVVDGETGKVKVVYRECYGDRLIWFRDKDEFYSDVPKDREKLYGQKKRFEIAEGV